MFLLEYYDTSQDVRVLYLEALLEKALKVFSSKKIPFVKHSDFIEALKHLLDVVRKIKWSYQPPEALSSQLERFLMNMSLLERVLGDHVEKADDFTKSFVKFLLRNLKTFPKRFMEKPDITNVVPIVVVRIISVEKHPNAQKLYVAWVTDGSTKYRVITNDGSVKKGDVLPLAILPPKEFMGIISEGMFIGGSSGIRRLSGDLVGKKPRLNDDEINKLRSEIINAINSLKS